MKTILRVGFLLIAFLLVASEGFAEQFLMINGDRISGQIVEEQRGHITVKTSGLGTVRVDKSFLKERLLEDAEKVEAAAKKKDKRLSGKVYGGFDRKRGNTKTTELTGGFALKHKIEKVHEFDLGADAYYGASNRKMNAQEYEGLARYAYSFGKEKKWYNFYKVEGDHDRFANIDARVTPSTGVGYWFSDAEDWKLMSEIGAGVTFTDYRNETKNETELVLIPRAYAEKRLIGASRVSQEAIGYPSLTDRGEYRLHLVTALTNPIADNLHLKIRWINDYNSDPGEDIKEHDMKLVSSVELIF